MPGHCPIDNPYSRIRVPSDPVRNPYEAVCFRTPCPAKCPASPYPSPASIVFSVSRSPPNGGVVVVPLLGLHTPNMVLTRDDA